MIELTVIGSDRPALVDDCRSDLVGYRWRLDKHGYVTVSYTHLTLPTILRV